MDTYWKDGDLRVTIKEVLKYLDKKKVPVKEESTDKLRAILIAGDKDEDRVKAANLEDAVIVVVDMEGNVTTLHENSDTDGADGSLDQPCEVVIRGNQLIVVNMDWYFESEYLINTKTERPFTLTKIEL